MSKLLLIVAALVLCVLPASADNMLINGDFETGDLYGWIEAGADTVPRYAARHVPPRPNPSPVQVFSADAPLYVMEHYNDETGTRHIRNLSLAPGVTPKSGYSAGWTRTGLGGPTNNAWISQILHVAPGRYLVNASWDVISWSPKAFADTQAAAGVLFVHLDDRVHLITLSETTLRRTVWNTESKGKWVSKSVEEYPIETNTGAVEVRLMFYQANENPMDPLDYEYVAFDNVAFELIPVALRQTGGQTK